VDNKMWLVFSVAAGLCWGTYVPLVHQGIVRLGNNSYGSFLCVGIAYFLIAVLFPISLFMMGEKTPTWTGSGITFATLAGVAGALGALCVIFANKAARELVAQQVAHGDVGGDYRLYIAPIIFALAPVINTLISLVWHPSPSKGIFHFGFENMPNWKFYLGIVLTGVGAALVLYSKEESEHAGKAKAANPPVIAPSGEKA
jgi:drug/metabolite transporter (DMT)-like permease